VAEEIKNAGIAWLDYDLYYKAKKTGFGDSYIANLINVPLDTILELRNNTPSVRCTKWLIPVPENLKP